MKQKKQKILFSRNIYANSEEKKQSSWNYKISFNHFYNFFNELNYDFYFEQKDYFQKIPNADSFNVTTDLVDILLVPKEKAIS